MKKPTRESKIWNERHTYNLFKRQKSPSNKRNKQSIRKTDTPTHTITCPQNFSLGSNFNGVCRVLSEIRTQSLRKRNDRTYIDIKNINNLSPAAALVLAAELDRWNRQPGKANLQSVDVSEWDPQVRALLKDMGFFELLQVSDMPSTNIERNIRYIKFKTGNRADGEVVDLLRTKDLEPVVGEIPEKRYLYGAITEAMTNVIHHAYSEKQVFKNLQNWWLSASYDSTKREVTIMVYDQGLGIPKTLPRNFAEQIQSILPGDHARLIETAHDLSRSSSEEIHRGHGLQRDVRGYLDKLNCSGHYRVVSLRGEYFYERKSDGRPVHKKISHQLSLNGTLIEWKLNLSNE